MGGAFIKLAFEFFLRSPKSFNASLVLPDALSPGEISSVYRAAPGQRDCLLKLFKPRTPQRAIKAYSKGMERLQKNDPAGSLDHFQPAASEFSKLLRGLPSMVWPNCV